MATKKQYTKEYKLDAISLVLDQGYTVSEAARGLEINANMLRRWIKEYQTDEDGQAFRGNGKLTLEQEEIRRLKLENKQLKLEKQNIKGGDGLLCERNEVKYSFITQKKKTYSVALMCRLYRVSRSAYYDYIRRQASFADDLYHAKLIDVIRDIAESSNYTYGSRRMKEALNASGYKGWSLES